MITLASVKEPLLRVKPDLVAKYHISSLGLFGSIVRDDFTNKSDIDIVVDFSEPIGIEFVDLADDLEKLLKRKVDLVSLKGIKPRYMVFIKPEIVYV